MENVLFLILISPVLVLAIGIWILGIRQWKKIQRMKAALRKIDDTRFFYGRPKLD